MTARPPRPRGRAALLIVGAAFVVAATASVALSAATARDDEPAAAPSPVVLDLEARPPKWLSAYRLFEGDGSDQRPSHGVTPYDVNTPLFSDYAAKHRFVWVPPGKSARYHAEEAFAFPVGTILIKTFAYPRDARDPRKGERLVETRLLIHHEDGWKGWPYIWNEEQTDARLKIAGGIREVAWIDAEGGEQSLRYIVPNANQCEGCHGQKPKLPEGVTPTPGPTKVKLVPIGPTARSLNRTLAYADGEANQLARWTERAILEGAPASEEAPRLAVWDDPETGSVEERARAWLEMNCAHCHNPRGPGNTTALDLRASQRDPLRFGVRKPPVAAGRGSGGRLHDIEPGDPDASIFVYRIGSTDPGIMMPELGRRLTHAEGLALVREWIRGMKDGE